MAVTVVVKRLLDNFKVAGTRGAIGYLAAELGRPPFVARCAMRGLPTVSLRPGTTDVHVYLQVFEQEEYRCPVAHAPEVIVDAGAHIGLATIYFSRTYPTARILALEPDPENFSILQRNTAALENVQAIQGALWNSAGLVRIVNPDDESWAFRVGVLDAEKGADPGTVVSAYTLADVLEMSGGDHVDILKLDIEGAEREVLAEAADDLDRVETIMVELHDRFVPGCSRAFYAATSDFPTEWHDGEVTGVSRRELPT